MNNIDSVYEYVFFFFSFFKPRTSVTDLFSPLLLDRKDEMCLSTHSEYGKKKKKWSGGYKVHTEQ